MYPKYLKRTARHITNACSRTRQSRAADARRYAVRSIMNIGVDFGGVLVPTSTDEAGNQSPFFDFNTQQYLEVGEHVGATDALLSIRDCGHKLFLVSKARARIKERTVQWLSHHNFLGRVFEAGSVHFCEKRHEKREICESLGVSVMVDDRRDVLAACAGVVPHLVLFGESRDAGYVHCQDWSEVSAFVQYIA